MPSSVTPLVPLNTGDPLSPLPTPASTNVWQSWTILVPWTPVLAHVFVMAPWVHPVVRPTLFTTESTLVWALIASLFIGNVMLLVLNLPLVGIWVKLLRIPRPYLYAGILLFASLGSYAIRADPLDLVLLLIIGLVGFAMRRFGWPVAPAVIGLILGPVAEVNLRRAIAIGEGNPVALVSSPFSVAVYVVALLVVVLPPVLRRRRDRQEAREEVSVG